MIERFLERSRDFEAEDLGLAFPDWSHPTASRISSCYLISTKPMGFSSLVSDGDDGGGAVTLEKA